MSSDHINKKAKMGDDTKLCALPKEGVDFTSLPWNLNLPEEHKYIHLTTTTGEWKDDVYYEDEAMMKKCTHDYSKRCLPLTPATTSLNYGTTIWEGLKCYRKKDGTPVVFRPDMNWERFCKGCEQMCLPKPSKQLFLAGVRHVIQENSTLIPPYGEGVKLYVRPMMMGSGQQLGLYPSPEFSLLFYVSPTGSYFKSATGGLKLHLETKRSRASRGGVGSVKCSGNYALALKPLVDAKKQGFHDNLFLELETYNKDSTDNNNLDDAIVQEMSAANFFLVLKTGEIVTPSLSRGTILAGVTRNSILAIVNQYKEEIKKAMIDSLGDDADADTIVVTASERDVKVGEFKNALEAFCTGTAAEVVPIASLATFGNSGDEDEFEVVFPHGTKLPGGPVTQMLLKILREIMVSERPVTDSTDGWLRDPFNVSKQEFCS